VFPGWTAGVQFPVDILIFLFYTSTLLLEQFAPTAPTPQWVHGGSFMWHIEVSVMYVIMT
jgi:hypothetical protein